MKDDEREFSDLGIIKKKTLKSKPKNNEKKKKIWNKDDKIYGMKICSIFEM